METHQYSDKADEMNTLLQRSSPSSPSSPSHRKSGTEMWLHATPEAHQQPSCWRKFLQGEKRDMTSLALWQACLAEFVGVFFLCFYTIGVGLSDSGEKGEEPGLLQVSLGVGFFIYVIISTLAAVSGGHVNPAVTLGFTVTGQCSIVRALLYIIFQCAGAYSGTMVLKLVVHEGREGNLGLITPPEKSSPLQVVAMEMFITGFLDFIIMAMLDPGRSDVRGSVPHVVGSTVTANILLAAGVSGGCMNPARATGPAVAMGNYEHIWMYWLGPCVGGMVGALFYQKLFSVGASLSNFLPCTADMRSKPSSKTSEEKARDLQMSELMS